MSDSPPQSPSQQHANVHAYASNGLEMLQAASDAAQQALTTQQTQALQNATVESVAQPNVSTAAAAVAAAASSAVNPYPQHHSADLSSVQLVQGAGLVGNGAAMMRDPTVNPKLTRLRRACDMCSMRKVKCDDTNIPCKPCRELGVDCTYHRETKRRGPPNKHAEAAKAAKRTRIEPLPPVFPSSPAPSNAAKTLLTFSNEGVLDAESIAPMPVLELLVDDFFTFIHPLAPFPHEPTFRQSFANREDRTRPEFLSLLASMIAALVASFPRCVREHLKAQHSTHLFPKSIVMIERCCEIALQARGSQWPLKQPKTLDDASTSYFLGLSYAYTHQHNASRHFMSETLTLIRELGFTRPKIAGEPPTFGNDPYSPDPLPFNHVKDQIGKRLFWCLLLGIRSFSQLGGVGGSQSDTVIAPSTPSLPYPTYPENIDDIYVVANQINDQSEGSVSLLTGFRFGIDIYTTMNGVVSLELAYGMSTLPWSDQRMLLREGLLAVKSIIGNLPPELQLGAPGEVDPMEAFEDSTVQYVPPLWPNAQPPHDIRIAFKTQPHRRRQLQYEIQKANIFVSELATRSYFVELYFDLRDVHLADHQNTVTPQTQEEKEAEENEDKQIFELMSTERELIVQDLLTVLGSISQRNLEPNGGSIINKIRQVASTLLNDAPERKGPFAIKSEEALSQLIGVLIKLERTGPVTNRSAEPLQMTPQDEEEELNHWSDLRDYQLRFAAHGGFTGNMLSVREDTEV
ncbi:unnamed protein product [Clonostachys solani]|uniref:Zn(2)-C6 fungal-type domain-containing protein n=1 Tax=Clonostachys solani TaxID=160281 RepID=A0A9N9ZH14_9HYPO|nr:unnamed protein product [Clonostachys solani]